MKTNDEKCTDEVPLIITNSESSEAPEAVEVIEDIEVSEDSEASDIPFAVTEEEAQASARQEARRANSVWSKLSAENLPQITLREILFGDYLIGTFLRGQLWFILLLVVLGVAYISNRYGAQQEIVEEERLRQELNERKNYALTQYAELTRRTRQSALEQQLRSRGDSTLLSSTEPPFMIEKR